MLERDDSLRIAHDNKPKNRLQNVLTEKQWSSA